MAYLNVVRRILENVCPRILSNDEVGVFFQPHHLWRYTAAFTHKSADPIQNYEILELKGDSILNYVASIYVRKRFPDVVSHVWLTNAKQTVISSRYLSKIGETLGLCDCLIASEDTMSSISTDPNLRERIMDDLFEAMLGALCRVADLSFCTGTGCVVVYHIIEKLLDAFTINMVWIDMVRPITIIKEIYDATPDVNGTKVEWKYGVSHTKFVKREDGQEGNREGHVDCHVDCRTTIYYPFRTENKGENAIAYGYGQTKQESLSKAIAYALKSKELRGKIDALIPDLFVMGKKMREETPKREPGISQLVAYTTYTTHHARTIRPEHTDHSEHSEHTTVRDDEKIDDANCIQLPTPDYFLSMVRSILNEGEMNPTFIDCILQDTILMRELVCSCINTSPHQSIQIIHELSLYEGVGIVDAVVVDHILASLGGVATLTEKMINEHKQNILTHDNFSIVVPDKFKNTIARVASENPELFSAAYRNYAKERTNMVFKAFLGCLASIIDRQHSFGIGFCIINTYLKTRLSKVELTRDDSIGALTHLFFEEGWGALANNCEYIQTGIVHTMKIWCVLPNGREMIGEGTGRNKKQALQIASKNALYTLKHTHNIVTRHGTKTTSTKNKCVSRRDPYNRTNSRRTGAKIYHRRNDNNNLQRVNTFHFTQEKKNLPRSS